MHHSQKTILLTGANSGVGRAVAQQLATPGVRLVLHGRNRERLEEVVAELADTAAAIDVVQADLSDLGQVRQLAADVTELTEHLDVLVHNAGVGKGATDRRQVSVDGYELRFAVNHLAPFALTQHLLPLLRAGAPSRIVNIASAAQEPLDFADPQLEHGYSGSRAYAQSKFAMVATGFRLATLVAPEVITVNSLHPATLMPTRMVRRATVIPSMSCKPEWTRCCGWLRHPNWRGCRGSTFHPNSRPLLTRLPTTSMFSSSSGR